MLGVGDRVVLRTADDELTEPAKDKSLKRRNQVSGRWRQSTVKVLINAGLQDGGRLVGLFAGCGGRFGDTIRWPVHRRNQNIGRQRMNGLLRVGDTLAAGGRAPPISSAYANRDGYLVDVLAPSARRPSGVAIAASLRCVTAGYRVCWRG